MQRLLIFFTMVAARKAIQEQKKGNNKSNVSSEVAALTSGLNGLGEAHSACQSSRIERGDHAVEKVSISLGPAVGVSMEMPPPSLRLGSLLLGCRCMSWLCTSFVTS